MRKTISLFVASLWIAAIASAHGGHAHQVLGTVKELNAEHIVVTTKDGKEVTVHLTEKTKYEKAGDTATRKDLTAGARVSVYLENDGKSAATVKIGAPRSK
jgi:predicted MarR family transcription regulator